MLKISFKIPLYLLRITVIIILYAAVLSSLYAQEYVFKQLKVKDGLSQSTVFCELQDSRGYMWFGTIDGLNRYDGYEFKVFTNDPSDTTSISDNVITSIYEDKNHNLWIGTVNGYLNLYDIKTGIFKRFFIKDYLNHQPAFSESYYKYPLAFSRNRNISVTSISEDSSGYLWVGTWGYGLLRFDKMTNKAQHFYHRNELENTISSNRITKVLIDRDGRVWAATFNGGLNRVNINKTANEDSLIFTNFRKIPGNNNSLNDDNLLSLFEDRDRNLWIGTFDGGLNRLSYEESRHSPSKAVFNNYVTLYDTDNCLCNNTVIDIKQDNKGFLWIGTFGGGIDRFNLNNQEFKHFFHDPLNPKSLPDNDILSLALDRSGILWAGSHLGEGVTKIIENRTMFNSIKKKTGKKNSLNDDVVWSIYEDNNKVLWIGTYRGGLNKFNMRTGRFKAYLFDDKDTNSLSDNHIRVIKQDKTGNLWIGTYQGGVNRFNPRTEKFTRFMHDKNNPVSLSENQIQDILIEPDSVIWIATFGGGLNKLTFPDGNYSGSPVVSVYSHNDKNPNSLSDNRVYDLFRDSKDNLWVATYGGGLNKFKPGEQSFEHYLNDPSDSYSISDDKVMTIYEDRNGNYWVGTSGGGLNKFHPASRKFKQYSQKNGLTSATVYGILEDNSNNLWMSTDNGIFKFNIKSERFSHFGIVDGLQSLEFNGGAYFKDKSGTMFFGGINGINYFRPADIRSNTFVPPVVITNINILNQPLKGFPNELRLPYDQNFISFEFSSLDYTNPKDNLYAFMMEGLEKNWKYVDSEKRIANYINLPPGNYNFKVTGTNSDGLWSRNGTSLHVIITPPFWQTWWFVTLIILLLGSIIYYLSTISIKHELAIEKLKTKLAADLHDNVGSSLTEISILSEVAAQKLNGNSETKELKSISNIARQLVDTMSDIVFVVNPERDSLYDLIIKIKDSYNDFLNSVGISFKVKNIIKTNDVKLPMNYKQNLLLIFKEGINNAIKHSKCSKLTLEAKIKGDMIEMILTDDGIGIDEQNVEFGNGLKNMETRARKINGTIFRESANGNGTVIKFAGKLSRFDKLKSIFTN